MFSELLCPDDLEADVSKESREPVWEMSGVWAELRAVAAMLETTNGKDKVLKMIQYFSKATISFHHEALLELPKEVVPKLAILAKQISTSRKLFRLGRTLHSLYLIHDLMHEKNPFLQVVGMWSWFFNAVWFICDHSAWMRSVGLTQDDPLLRVNRVCVVLMQSLHLLTNTEKILLSFRKEGDLEQRLATLQAAKAQPTGTSSGDAAGSAGSGSVDNTAAVTSETVRPASKGAPDRTDAGGVVDPAKQQAGDGDALTEDELIEALDAHRFSRNILWLGLIKNIGDLIVGYDFGFQLSMSPLVTHTSGSVSGVAGVYLELIKASQARRQRAIFRPFKQLKPTAYPRS